MMPLFLRYYQSCQPDITRRPIGEKERKTGLEPATNNLEGCDSTIELLPLERGVISPY